MNGHIIGTGGGTINFAGSLVDGNLIDVTGAASFGSISYDYGSSIDVHSPDCVPVPEPSTGVLLGLGFTLLGGISRTRVVRGLSSRRTA